MAELQAATVTSADVATAIEETVGLRPGSVSTAEARGIFDLEVSEYDWHFHYGGCMILIYVAFQERILKDTSFFRVCIFSGWVAQACPWTESCGSHGCHGCGSGKSWSTRGAPTNRIFAPLRSSRCSGYVSRYVAGCSMCYETFWCVKAMELSWNFS